MNLSDEDCVTAAHLVGAVIFIVGWGLFYLVYKCWLT